MNIQEYRNWRPTYSLYEKNYVKGDSKTTWNTSFDNILINQFLATTGLAAEASELMAVVHKAMRKRVPVDLLKAKDEASDVWWYLNKVLDDFGWTFEELSEYNKNKLDERHGPGKVYAL